MNLMRRRNGLNRLQDEMNDVFGRFFQDWGGGTYVREWAPELDLSEKEDALLVRAEMPGLESDDINISVENNVLTISGEKRDHRKDEGENYYHVERRYGTFRRDITLPANIDPDKIEAEYTNGVLTIHLPKSEQSKPKRIAVKS
jgi:HSP20 family protein